MNKQIAIQMDDLSKIDYDYDTSFMIAIEGQKRGYKIFYYNPHELFMDRSHIKAKGYYVKLVEDKKSYYSYLTEKIELDLSEFKFIFLRQDPPFDMNYITTTYILDCLPKKTIVINNPSAVRNSTEKIYTFQFKQYMAPTIVTQNIEDIKKFFLDHKDIIIKPLYGNGGEGIYRCKDGIINGVDINKDFLDQPIMIQKFIPEINQGDRRIILIDGEYAGSVARIPEKGKIKANFHAGGKAKKIDLVFRDEEIIEVVGPELKKRNLFFAGIDIIGKYLTEINVTSPTGIKQINQLNNVQIEKVFWDKLEAKYKIV